MESFFADKQTTRPTSFVGPLDLYVPGLAKQANAVERPPRRYARTAAMERGGRTCFHAIRVEQARQGRAHAQRVRERLAIFVQGSQPFGEVKLNWCIRNRVRSCEPPCPDWDVPLPTGRTTFCRTGRPCGGSGRQRLGASLQSVHNRGRDGRRDRGYFRHQRPGRLGPTRRRRGGPST